MRKNPQFPSHCLLSSDFQTNQLKMWKLRLWSPLPDFLFLTFLSFAPLVGSTLFRVDVDEQVSQDDQHAGCHDVASTECDD